MSAALAFAGVVVTVPALAAQDVRVRSFLDRTTVGVNQQFILSVQVDGTQQIDANPTLPDMDAFATLLGSGSSRQVNIVNGRTTVTVKIDYRFQARAEGTHQIGRVTVTAGGRTYQTDPLSLEISSSPAAGPGNAPGNGLDPEDLYLRTVVSKRRVYQNEPVIVEYRIYTRISVNSYNVTGLPSTAGFWVEEYEQDGSPTVENEIIDGRQYATAVIRKVALFPTATGEVTVEPMTIEAQIRTRSSSRDPFDSFFRSGSLFGRTVTTLVTSEPVTIEVLPLPSAGRPDDFTGLVGRLSLDASVDRADARTNEALTLAVRIEGEGNLRTLPDPAIAFPPSFEVYPPETSERVNRESSRVTGSKTYEYVLIPRVPGDNTIPPVQLSYFDPASATYETVSTTPITLAVTGDPVGGPVLTNRTRGGVAALRDDIRFIRLETAALRPIDRTTLTSARFWLAFALPLVVLAGAFGLRRHRDRIQGDVAYARTRRASRLARKRLAAARSHLAVESHKQFFAECGKALQGFLGDKLNIPAAGLIKDEARGVLAGRDVPPDVVDEYMACLDECDRQRFAPAAPDPARMQAFVERVEAAMSALERGLAT